MKNNMSSKYAFFTVDVERFSETECVANSDYSSQNDMMDGLDIYMNLLDKYNIKATMFVLRETALRYKNKLNTYIKNGHRLALHGNCHEAPIDMEVRDFERDIIYAKEILEDTFDSKILGYRAPFFGIDNSKLQLLKDLGFRYDASCLNYTAARHTTTVSLDKFSQLSDGVCVNDSFYEFESSSERIFGADFPVSGGGYLRLANWHFSKQLLNKYINNHNYYMFYVHPFELSRAKKPYIHGLKFYDRIYLGYGFLSYPKKIEYIIRKLKKAGYEFVTFEDVVEKELFFKNEDQ